MSGICSKKTLALLAAVLGLSAATATNAATKIWDFNTDPSADIAFDGAVAKWVATGGVTGGYISISDAVNGVQGTALFPDVDAGAAVSGFTLDAQIRIGGGTARPADGMSFNWIPSGGDTTLASGEDGVSQGIAISLDTWDNNGADSAPAIEVKLNQRILGEADSAGQREGGRPAFGPQTYDIQTGASFVPIKVVYKNSFLSVTYKGVELIKGAYAATTLEAKQLFVAARTGNANENHWVDDLKLVTILPTDSFLSRVGPDPILPHGMGGSTALDSKVKGDAVIEVDINDGTASTLSNGSVVMKFDNTVVTPTFAKAGGVTTVSFDPPGLMVAGSKHTVDVSFNAGSETASVSYSFWVSPLTAGTLYIEAEDMNYDGGQHKTEADSLTYTGEAYAGLSAVLGVDYNDPGTVENAAYRTDISVSMTGHFDVDRYDHNLTANYKVGWNDGGDWYNYTRTFVPHAYRVLAHHSSGGADTHTKMSIIGGATGTSQTVIDVGNFDVPASNGWDTFRFVELKDSAGNPVIVNLAGEQTVRMTIVGGNDDFNYFAFIPATGGTTAIASITPGDNGVVSPLDPWSIQGSILDQSVTVDPASVKLTVNGTQATETATKANGFSNITHPMPIPGYGAVYTVKLDWTENGTAKSKTVTIRAGGGVTRRVFSGISGTSLQALFDADAYKDNAPDIETTQPKYETPADVADNYGVELLAYFSPTVTADYTFEISADDNAVLYLSTDDQPYNKVAIARQNGWNATRNWLGDDGGNGVAPRTSAPIHLIAGTKYFTQAIMKEGGGGDNLSILATKPGDPAKVNGQEPTTFEMRPFPGIGFGAIARSATYNQGVPISLVSQAIAGPGGPITYQWFKGTVAIGGATSATLDLGPANPADSGASYFVRATVTPTAGGAAISSDSPAAVITITADTTAPTITRATPRDLADIIVGFNEPVPNTPTFTLNNGATVIDATPSADFTFYKLHTSILNPATTYTVTTANAKDYANNVGTTSKQFTPTLLSGYSRWEYYANIGGGNVSDLTGNARFPDSPTTTDYRKTLEGPVNAFENYGSRLSGYFIAPSNGNYVFFVSSDDGGALFLSTDEDPANKKQIAAEGNWSNNRNWAASDNGGATLADKRSDTFGGIEWPTGNIITLVANKRYYIEILQKEGGGGDNAGATFKLQGAADPANGTASIGGSALGVIADPIVQITSPANNANITAGQNAAITVSLASASGMGKVEFFANGTKLAETTAAPFTLNLPGAAVVPGYYIITAKATDAYGSTFTSDPVIVQVHPPASANAKKLLFGFASGGAFASDISIMNHLAAIGYDVTGIPCINGTAAIAATMDATIISSTAGSGDSNSKYRNITQGFLTWENNIEDDMLWTLNGGTDHNVATATSITLSAAGAAHPIGAGFAAGDVQIFNTAQSMAYGFPSSGAHLLGTIPFQTAQNNLFTYDKGDALISGGAVAAGRRVLFPLDDNSWNDINANGRKLFDQAVAWIAVTPPSTPATLTISNTGTSISIGWTPAGGKLQSASSVSGPWTDVAGGTANPFAGSAATGTTFYRVSN